MKLQLVLFIAANIVFADGKSFAPASGKGGRDQSLHEWSKVEAQKTEMLQFSLPSEIYLVVDYLGIT